MIYLKATTEMQWVPVPIQWWNAQDLNLSEGWPGSLDLYCTFDNRPVNVALPAEAPQDMAAESDFGHYILLGLQIESEDDAPVTEGSHELTLEIRSPKALAGRETFVVQVGGYTPSGTKQYDKTIEYEQYI